MSCSKINIAMGEDMQGLNNVIAVNLTSACMILLFSQEGEF